ncbi:GNAT family N-acetyltransferase [Phytomonospora endophytica]|uniref:GNAT superfamily N-acetyltransferase n=1 Tax=Phytomonospora endophytica TaxID=714109 RepID=A0A841FLU5_9ACTN|nr:GNAT family N-acetyltransferase [Phytomonospora endophytica]MBB6034502.1 GNAT superfamily N-acetyltransferase [Phytomonospora endophytica]GIG70409.1 N-acetyltransferase [Phytomonospora endophytica]
MSDLELHARGPATDEELNELFAASWPGEHRPIDFSAIHARSLTWVIARRDGGQGDPVGYVNVATDGGAHAFLLDTTVHPDLRLAGLGRRLVLEAVADARARGAAWLHVDYEPHLEGFYRSCGFRPTTAGLLRLDGPESA